MDFKLEIKSKESGDIIIEKDYVKAVEYLYDTQDNNSLDKSRNINITLKITGELSKGCKSQTMNIAKWALMTKGQDVYRIVNVTVEDIDGIIREYILNDAFVLDYKEFNPTKSNGEFADKLSWSLLVSQKGDRLDGVKVKD